MEKTMDMEQREEVVSYNRAKVWQLVMFAMNNASTNIYLFTFMFVTYFSTGVLGLAAIFVSQIMGYIRIFDGFIDPAIGIMIDKTDTKFGKYRPILIIGNVITALSLIFLLALRGVDENIRFPLFILVLIIHKIGYSMQQTITKAGQTAVFMELCRLYKKYGFVTQVHFGALRNNHSTIFEKLGADVGVDSLGDQVALTVNMNRLLDSLVKKDSLPKMIWYNLNPAYNIAVANTLANFQANELGVRSYLQFGAGWWFADTKLGMISQMNALAEQGMLANFIGMLTDSRSFLSYQRHDYFRRILCTYLGEWIEEGEVPEDYQALGSMAKDIAYQNAVNYFKN
ncbi:TPA: glucuronate isomerase [Streptococcus agalactiae]